MSGSRRRGQLLAIDGIHRSPAVDRDIDLLAKRVFEGREGERFLTYLEHITLRQALPPGTEPHALAHKEGQRWIVALIRKRMERASHHLESGDDNGPLEPDEA